MSQIPEGATLEPIGVWSNRLADKMRKLLEQHMQTKDGEELKPPAQLTPPPSPESLTAVPPGMPPSPSAPPNPETHHFSISKFREAAPNIDIAAAIAEAKREGFSVVD